MTDANDSPPAMTLETYRFPAHRLRRQLREPNRTPLVLVAPGSFSPITFLHLRMFEMAADFTRFNTPQFEVVAGYLSPVSDSYQKPGLEVHQHRVRMVELAAEQTSRWLMVDPWEAMHERYVPTAKMLDHVEAELARELRDPETGEVGVLSADGTERLIPRIAVLAGADLIQTMSTPGVWAPRDLEHILGHYGVFIVERQGTDMEGALSTLQQWKDNIYVIQQIFQNNMSSTQVRLHLRRDMSVRYLIPECVIDYIEENGLYQGNASERRREKGKSVPDKAGGSGGMASAKVVESS